MSTSRPFAPRIVGLVADDLTGASDAVATFADAGWHAEILLRGRPRPNASARVLYAINTDARHSEHGAAASLTSDAVRTLAAAGAERLYLKVDSTIRGSIAGQLDGAVSAWHTTGAPASAVICPAFPAQDRTVREGAVFVGGVPVTDTAAGRDPVAPVRSAIVTDIVPDSSRGGVDDIGHVPRLVVDAATDVDLDAIAAAVSAAPPSTIAVGSGGLAAALARRWHYDDGLPSPGTDRGSGVLIAVSSLHPASEAQVSYVRGRVGEDDAIISTARSTHASAADAVAALTAQVIDALARHRFAALVLVGGDGASAVLHALGTESVIIHSQMLPGCASGVLIGGAADGLRLVTKSGGFGDPTTLSTILSLLAQSSAPAIIEKKATHD